MVLLEAAFADPESAFQVKVVASSSSFLLTCPAWWLSQMPKRSPSTPTCVGPRADMVLSHSQGSCWPAHLQPWESSGLCVPVRATTSRKVHLLPPCQEGHSDWELPHRLRAGLSPSAPAVTWAWARIRDGLCSESRAAPGSASHARLFLLPGLSPTQPSLPQIQVTASCPPTARDGE